MWCAAHNGSMSEKHVKRRCLVVPWCRSVLWREVSSKFAWRLRCIARCAARAVPSRPCYTPAPRTADNGSRRKLGSSSISERKSFASWQEGASLGWSLVGRRNPARRLLASASQIGSPRNIEGFSDEATGAARTRYPSCSRQQHHIPGKPDSTVHGFC